MAKSVSIQEIVKEIKNQITLAEDQLGSAYNLTHSIGESEFLTDPQIMKNDQGYIPKMSGQVQIKTIMDLKFKVNSVGFSLKHCLCNTLNFVFDYNTKAIDFTLAPNEDGSNTSKNTFFFNGNSEIHNAKKQKIAELDNKQLKFLDNEALSLLESEMPMQCSSQSALAEFKRLLTSPNIKTPLKIAMDNKFKILCKQAF